MAAFSSLFRFSSRSFQNIDLLAPKFLVKHAAAIQQITNRGMSHSFTIVASKWQWNKTKDLLHFYFMVAAIPLTIVTFCANIFIGPATLTPIPEGYYPKHWEYHKSPITRFFARYCHGTPQKDYEKNVFHVWEEDQIRKIRVLERMVYSRMDKRQDYRYGYFTPFETFQLRERRELVKFFSDGIRAE